MTRGKKKFACVYIYLILYFLPLLKESLLSKFCFIMLCLRVSLSLLSGAIKVPPEG